MAFVGSLSGSVGTIAVTGSLIPGATNTYSIGTSGAKWTAVVTNQLTGSLTKLADATDYLIAGTNVFLSTGSNGAITISTAYVPPITVVTASLTASIDSFLVAKPSSANIAITLPSASIDDTIIVKHGSSSSFDVTINPSGSDTIDGQASYLITSRQSLSLSYEGGVWHIR